MRKSRKKLNWENVFSLFECSVFIANIYYHKKSLVSDMRKRSWRCLPLQLSHVFIEITSTVYPYKSRLWLFIVVLLMVLSNSLLFLKIHSYSVAFGSATKKDFFTSLKVKQNQYIIRLQWEISLEDSIGCWNFTLHFFCWVYINFVVYNVEDIFYSHFKL